MSDQTVPGKLPPRRADLARRTDQVVEVLRGLREQQVDTEGSAGPQIDEAIREYTRVADGLRAREDGAAGAATATKRGARGRRPGSPGGSTRAAWGTTRMARGARTARLGAPASSPPCTKRSTP